MSEETRRGREAEPVTSEEHASMEDRRSRALPMAGETTAVSDARAAASPQASTGALAPPATPANDPRASSVAREGSMDRRHALKVMALAAAAPGLASCSPESGGGGTNTTATADGNPSGATPGQVANPNARGDLWDPDLLSPVVPWERQLNPDELESLSVLCDLILPADDRSPSASEVGAHDFIDEWVSAPYEATREGGVLIRGGLVWLDREAHSRFGGEAPSSSMRFRDLGEARRHAICDDICDPARAEGGPFEAASLFFDRVRHLTLTAFWTTAEGMEDLEYIGNTPLTRWDPPPPEVLRHIGLA